MKVIIIICSVIILVVILKNIIEEEKYRKLYLKEKEKKEYLENKLKEVSKILKEEEKTPMYNRNSYKTIRDIKNIIKGVSYENK